MTNRSFLILVLLCVPASDAWAYVDPGTGMLLWQGLIASIGAFLSLALKPSQIVRNLWEKFRRKPDPSIKKHSQQ